MDKRSGTKTVAKKTRPTRSAGKMGGEPYVPHKYLDYARSVLSDERGHELRARKEAEDLEHAGEYRDIPTERLQEMAFERARREVTTAP